MEEKICEQENILSENLQRIHRLDRVYIPLYGFVIGFVTIALNIYFRGITTPWKIALPYAILLIICILVHLQHRLIEGNFPKTVYYSNAGIGWITRRGKEVFVPWNNIIKASPIVDYGKRRGYGNGKVSDYILYFKKPFPGFTPVSAEVGQKIEEYLREFREKEGFLNKANK